VSTIILKLGGLLVGVILARILTPDQFGVYAVALTVQAILMTLADLGLSADLIRTDHPDRIAPTVATLGLLSGSLLTVTTVLLSGPLADLLGSPEAGPAIAVLSFSLLLGGAAVVPFAMLQRRFQQKELFFAAVVDFVVSTTVTLTLIALGFGVLGLAIGRVCAQLAAGAMMFVFAKVIPRLGIDRTVVRPVLAFGLPIAAANLLSWALINADNVVLARMVGVTALGYYVLAFNISSWPMSALSQMVRSIALPYFSRAGMRTGTLAAVASLAWALALPAGAALAVLAESVIAVVYGPRWLPGAGALAALGVYGALRVVFDVFAGCLYAAGRSRPVLWVQLASLVPLVGAVVAGAHLWGIVGAGWAHVVVATGVVLPAYLLVLHRSGIAIGPVLWAAAPPTLAVVPAVSVALGIRLLVDDALPALLLGGLGFALVYLLVLRGWILRRVRLLRDPASAEAPV
jgi:O-antigen/teichoic acid export membrane protein